jgi:ADP-heptose:LPS heptosyltransferase
MKSILLTGGVGDVLAVESLMTDNERQEINCIYYATRAYKPCMDLFENLPSFPELKKQTIIWKDFSRIFAFHNKKHLEDKLCAYQPNALQEIAMKLMEPIEDYSIQKIFYENRPYTYSSFIKHTIANIKKFSLPANYYCICPYSSNDKRDIRRDYDHFDWGQTLKILKERNVFGVVINVGDESIPIDPSIINLSNKTLIREAIEIIKHAKGYIGIDTAFSVIAAKIFKPENIIVKCVNEHCFKWAHIYFKPLTTFEFLKAKVQ